MSQQEIRSQIINELRIGRLALAMTLLEDNQLPLDEDVRKEAEACIGSLRRHFHWIIPVFVAAFNIRDDPDLNLMARRIIALSLQHGQPLIAELAARTFGIEFDDAIKRVICEAKTQILRAAEQAGVIVLSNDSGKYTFEIE